MQVTFTKTQIASAITIFFLLFIGFVYIAIHQSPAEAKAEEMVANKEAWAALEEAKQEKLELIATIELEVAEIEEKQAELHSANTELEAEINSLVTGFPLDRQ